MFEFNVTVKITDNKGFTSQSVCLATGVDEAAAVARLTDAWNALGPVVTDVATMKVISVERF